MNSTEQNQPEVQLRYGAMSDTISKQLTVQGFKFDKKLCEHWQKDADAITRIRIRGILTANQTEKARIKLLNIIAKTLNPKTK